MECVGVCGSVGGVTLCDNAGGCRSGVRSKFLLWDSNCVVGPQAHV